MLQKTWDLIFSALKWVFVIGIFLYYVHPAIYGTHINLCIAIYILIWFFVLLFYYFFNKKTNAEVEGLWILKPQNTNSAELYDLKTKKMVRANGMIDLLSESDSIQFMKETFTFGFFVSIDKSSIEMVDGTNLKNDFKPYQLIVTIPGVYDIYIDPFHEMLSIEFYSYNASKYTVNIPTLKNQKWNQVLITIEGRSVDIYQNGVLLKSVELENVVASRPGKPKINMNPKMFARVALVQSWPKKLQEVDIINNYRSTTDIQGVPPIPKPVTFFSGIPELKLLGMNLCVGSFCLDSIESENDALSYVNYNYA